MTIETTTTTSPLEELDKFVGESTKEDTQTLGEYLQFVIDKYEGKKQSQQSQQSQQQPNNTTEDK